LISHKNKVQIRYNGPLLLTNDIIFSNLQLFSPDDFWRQVGSLRVLSWMKEKISTFISTSFKEGNFIHF
jgi:hypothetical protein